MDIVAEGDGVPDPLAPTCARRRRGGGGAAVERGAGRAGRAGQGPGGRVESGAACRAGGVDSWLGWGSAM